MFTIANVIQAPVARADRRSRRRHLRTERVLDAAMQLLATHGLEGLTLHRLAAQLGYVTTALYRYFDSKDELLAALQRRTIEELHQRFRDEQSQLVDQPSGLSPAEHALLGLLAAGDFYLSLPSSLPERFRLVSLLLGDPRTLIERGAALGSAQALIDFLGDVRELFERAAEHGALEPGPAFDRTLGYWSALHGVTTLDKLARFDADTFHVKRLGALTARGLLAGWGADSAALDAADHALAKLHPASGNQALARAGKRTIPRRTT